MRFRSRGGTRLFFAADVHGSEPTWRKFVNAAAFYGADALIFGGDLMGKALVPIVRANGGLRAELQGEPYELDGAAELRAFADRVATLGHYWCVVDADELAAMRDDPLLVEGRFVELARERLRSWTAFALDRLAGTGVRLYVTGGNDDAPAVLEVLDDVDGEVVVACEGAVVDLDGSHTMVTVGVSTPTPWDTAREAPEQEIAALIERDAAVVPDPARCVFNLHCPPKGTLIDECLKLRTEGLAPGELPRPIREGGRFVTTHGGSAAVADAIARYQPVVGLHGHIHESPGRVSIGRTRCFNPGSEYAQGRLEGVLVEIAGPDVLTYQHTSG